MEDITNHGAVGDGVTDDLPAINAALAASPNGGEISFPPAPVSYAISAPINLATEGIRLAGESRRVKISALPAFRSGDMVKVTGKRCGIENLLISGGDSMRTGGAGINAIGSTPPTVGIDLDCRLYDVDFERQFDAVRVTGAQGHFTYEGGLIDYPAPGGTGITIATPLGGEQSLHNIFMHGRTFIAADQAAAFIRMTNSVDFQFSKLHCVLCREGLLIDPSANDQAAMAVASGRITDCYFDTCSQAGVRIAPSNGATVAMIIFTNLWSAGHGQGTGGSANASGVELDASHGIIRSIEFNSASVYMNKGNGLWAHQNGQTFVVQNLFINGGDFSSNAYGQGHAGILLDGVSYWAARNVFAGGSPWYGSIQPVGLKITPGANHFVLTGNQLLGNNNSNLLDQSGAVNKVVANNLT